MNEEGFDFLAFAEQEFNHLESKSPRDGICDFRAEIMALARKIHDTCAGYNEGDVESVRNVYIESTCRSVAEVLTELGSGVPISKLEDMPDQWYDDCEYFRHKRCNYVRKNKQTGEVEFERAITFVGGGFQQYGPQSIEYVLLPMTPKTFTVLLDDRGKIVNRKSYDDYSEYYTRQLESALNCREKAKK